MPWRWTFLLLGCIFGLSSAQQNAECSEILPCAQGCCSPFGSCGFGDDFCGEGCLGSCNATAECGEHSVGNVECPLGVCCSRFGFCGTTADFCGDGCQSGCEEPEHETCDSHTDVMKLKRRVGYYEMFNLAERECDRFLPEHILASAFTHINLAFAVIDQDFKITHDDGDIVTRAAHLKDRYEGLRINIAIGGWAFNDPPTATRWSDMVTDYENTNTFIDSLVNYLRKYGLDGVDLDWEYPVADDRGGAEEDYQNFVVFCSRLRERFEMEEPGWEITLTLPASYWYLRGFDLENLQKYVDYFNLMSYDFHGLWDQHNDWTGPYLKGHTNLTEVKMGLDLLWRNGVKPENVVMGFGFYGRSFTMSDANCHDPNAGCQFASAGLPGDCSASAGILTYAEIQSRNKSLNSDTYYDAETTTKYMTYLSDQWISYDDEQSFSDKKKFMTSQCLSGLMVWAVDQDTQNYDALHALLGDAAMEDALTRGGELSDEQKEKLSNEFASFTGQNCFVTELCTDGSDKESGPLQLCPAGTSSVSTAHAPLQMTGEYGLVGQCSTGWYRHICCPNNQMPTNCEWNGEPIRSSIGCTGKCGSNQFELSTDTYLDAEGEGECFQGHRSLCCDSTELLNQCFWSGCQGPLNPTQPIGEIDTEGCPSGYESVASRFDTNNGGWCSNEFNSNLHDRFKQGLCCPKSKGFNRCQWTTSDLNGADDGETSVYDPSKACQPRQCKKTQTKLSEAWEPAPLNAQLGRRCIDGHCTVGEQCSAYPILPEYDSKFYLCCDPPSEYDENWPVPPSWLWEDAYEDEGDDVAWAFADNQGNNNQENDDDPVEEDPSDQAYGFLMLDGPPESIDNAFGDTYTVARRSTKIDPSIKRRSMITTNTTILASTFDHADETVYVYCNYPAGSPECEKIFIKGAEDTIIKLPDHVGEGPFARIVSMEPAPEGYQLPHHHTRARALNNNDNQVFRMKFDYNFHLIKRDDGPVNMRIDYTNLLPYWDEVTNSDPAARKRSLRESMSQSDWKSIIATAHSKSPKSKRSNLKTGSGTTDMVERSTETGIAKRWFGKFLDWLQRMNTVEAGNDGFLPLALKKSFLLYRAAKGCSQRGYYAEMKMFLDADVSLDATYAYYLSGTIVPLKVTNTYGYLGVEPSAYLGLRIDGNAILTYTSEWKKLVDTLAYPGLSIKGIATVGPSLDIYGRIRGTVTLSGQARAGARVHFGRAELYFPQGEDGTEGSTDYDKINNIRASQERPQTGLEPQFYASAQASAALAIDVSPNARLGIEVGPSVLGSDNLVDAQIIAFMNTTLEFKATIQGSVGTSTDPTYSYEYGAYLYYNLGYGGYANILGGTWNWHFQPVFLYEGQGMKYTIYHNDNVESDSSLNSKRDLQLDRGAAHEPDDPLDDLSELGVFDDSDKSDTDDVSYDTIEPYKPPSLPPKQLRHDRQRSVRVGSPKNDWQHANATSLMPNAQSAFYKRADDGDIPMPDAAASAQFFNHQNFTCPARGPRDPILPDFRYNCKVFSAIQAQGNGNSRLVRGICDGILGYLGQRALPTGGLVLTWDPNRRKERDAYTCNKWNPGGKSYCTVQDQQLKADLGITSKEYIISCDEFPFGGVEEGGEFGARYAQPRIPPTANCVPRWQQDIQGHCNQMLSSLYTNVAYYDRDASDTTTESWKKWSLSNKDNSRWTPGGSINDPNPPAFGRLTRYYGQVMPLSHNLDYDEWDDSNYELSYNMKRNFTFGVAYGTSLDETPDQWGSMRLQDYTLITDGTTGTDPSNVFCAINLHNQPDVYRFGTHNGMCYSERRGDTAAGFGRRPGYARCKVNFVGSLFDDHPTPGTWSKRSSDPVTGGSGEGWKIESVEIDPDPDAWTPLPEDEFPLIPEYLVSGDSIGKI